jgi:putative flippase GtrA
MRVGSEFLRTSATIRPLLYLAAGAVNTLFGYVFYAVLLMVRVPPLAAVIVAAIGGTLFNFRTIGAVFGSRDVRVLPRFLAVYAAYLGFNLLGAHGLLGIGLSPLLAQAACLAVLAPCSFIAMQRFVFLPAAQGICQS